MTIHVEPTDLVGVEHRTLAFTRYRLGLAVTA